MTELPIGRENLDHIDSGPQPGHQHGGMMFHISDYWKGIIAAGGAVSTTVVAASTDGGFNAEDVGFITASVMTLIFVVLGPRNTVDGRRPE